jgi:hypothetical protein
VGLGVEQDRLPLFDQIIVGLVKEQALGQFHQLGAQAFVSGFGDAQVR